jgi:hypothetical protein
VTVASLGSSRCVLDTGDGQLVQLSEEHRISSNLRERQRLLAAACQVAAVDVSGAGPAATPCRASGALRLWPGGIGLVARCCLRVLTLWAELQCSANLAAVLRRHRWRCLMMLLMLLVPLPPSSCCRRADAESLHWGFQDWRGRAAPAAHQAGKCKLCLPFAHLPADITLPHQQTALCIVLSTRTALPACCCRFCCRPPAGA